MDVRKVKYTAERFMEEVQKYECPNNKYSKDFKDCNKKSNAWNAVVSQFHDLSQSEAVNKLKNIRSAYTRFLKRKKSTPSGSGRDAFPTSKEFQNLEWLSTFIDHRPTWNNLKKKKKTSIDAGSDSEEEENQSIVSPLDGDVDDGDLELPGKSRSSSATPATKWKSLVVRVFRLAGVFHIISHKYSSDRND